MAGGVEYLGLTMGFPRGQIDTIRTLQKVIYCMFQFILILKTGRQIICLNMIYTNVGRGMFVCYRGSALASAYML